MTVRFLQKFTAPNGIPVGWGNNMLHNLRLSLQRYDDAVLDYWNEVSMNGEEGALQDVLVFLKHHNLTRNLAEEWEQLNNTPDEEEESDE